MSDLPPYSLAEAARGAQGKRPLAADLDALISLMWSYAAESTVPASIAFFDAVNALRRARNVMAMRVHESPDGEPL